MTPDTASEYALMSEGGAIDSRRLQVFLAAARTSSFVAAAEMLRLVPSAVSHAIRTLEEEFECSLFKRHGPRVTLTRAGIRLMPLAEELLGRMAEVRRELAVIRGSGRFLRVMMPEAFCSGILPKILPDFMECFPSALFEVSSAEDDPQMSMKELVSGRTDLLLHQKQELGGEIVRRDLFQEAWGFYVASFHPWARGEIDLQALAQWPFLTPSAVAGRMCVERLGRLEQHQPRLWCLPSLGSVMDLTRVGQGVGVLPLRWASEALGAGELALLSLGTGPAMTWTWSCYWSGKMDPSWAGEVFMSLAGMMAQEEGD